MGCARVADPQIIGTADGSHPSWGKSVHVWIVRSGALGDFVCTLPVLQALRRHAGHLTVVSNPRYRPLFPSADRWVHPDGTEALGLFAGSMDLSGVALGVAWTRASGEALTRCGVPRVLVGEPEPPPGESMVVHLAGILHPLSIVVTEVPKASPDPGSLAAVGARLTAAGVDAPVVIAPGSGGAVKRWPLSAWRRVAARLQAAGVPVVWVGGPLEREEGGWGSPRLDDLDVAGLLALARLSGAWLGPDAGPGHVAAAAGARVGVVFNGTTDPRCWAPPGAEVFAGDASPDSLASWALAARCAGHASG